MESKQRAAGVLVRLPDPAASRSWLCSNLFFSASDGLLRSGDCVLYLERGGGLPLPKPQAGSYYAGLAHLALAAQDINAALAHCTARGLTLQTDGGKAFYNPGVFGGGEFYFNILTPSGAVIEVAQRAVQPLACPHAPIEGLDHLGVPCADFDAECRTLEKHGFAPLFAPVHNRSDTEGRILCTMLSNGRLTLEVYQFLDLCALPMPKSAVLCALRSDFSGRTPSGLTFITEGSGLNEAV